MAAALQRWFWLMIVWPACGVIAAKAENGLPQASVKIEHCSDEEVASINGSLTRALALLRVKRRQHN
jgi:hypothetical protein